MEVEEVGAVEGEEEETEGVEVGAEGRWKVKGLGEAEAGAAAGLEAGGMDSMRGNGCSTGSEPEVAGRGGTGDESGPAAGVLSDACTGLGPLPAEEWEDALGGVGRGRVAELERGRSSGLDAGTASRAGADTGECAPWDFRPSVCDEPDPPPPRSAAPALAGACHRLPSPAFPASPVVEAAAGTEDGAVEAREEGSFGADCGTLGSDSETAFVRSLEVLASAPPHQRGNSARTNQKHRMHAPARGLNSSSDVVEHGTGAGAGRPSSGTGFA
jgi:hypothetical protein